MWSEARAHRLASSCAVALEMAAMVTGSTCCSSEVSGMAFQPCRQSRRGALNGTHMLLIPHGARLGPAPQLCRHAGHPLLVPPHLHKLGAVDPAFLAQHRLQRQLDGEVGDPQLGALDRNLQ